MTLMTDVEYLLIGCGDDDVQDLDVELKTLKGLPNDFFHVISAPKTCTSKGDALWYETSIPTFIRLCESSPTGGDLPCHLF